MKTKKANTPETMSANHLRQLVEDYRPLVLGIAKSFRRRLPSYYDLDDLVSVGIAGLIDAFTRFDPTRDSHFRTYGETRIRGAIADELRRQDHLPRQLRQQAKAIRRAEAVTEARDGATSGQAVAETMGVDVDTLHQMRRDTDVSFVSLDSSPDGTVTVATQQLGPEEAALRSAMDSALQTHVGSLPVRQQQILRLYYWENIPIRDIAAALQISEARVSQIHHKALDTIRERMTELAAA